MPLSNFKKILFAGTALVAVSAFSTQALAAAPDRVLTANGIWASLGTKNAATTAIADALATNKVDGAFALTVTNDATADDGSVNKNTFVLGAVGGTTPITGFTTVNGSANDLTVTAASVVGAASPISISNTGFALNGNTTAITGLLTNTGGTLAVTNVDSTTAKTVSLTVGGVATVVGATTVTAGTFLGADSSLILNGVGNNSFAGGVTLANGAGTTGKAFLTFGAGANLTAGTVDGAAAGAGTLTFLGNSSVTGAVGLGTKLATINIDGANATLVTLNGASANTLNFSNDGKVTIATGNLIAAVTTTGVSGTGTLTLGGPGTMTGQVGTSAKWLKAVNAGVGGAVTFNNDVYAATIRSSGTTAIAFKGNVTATTLLYGASTATITIASGKNLTAAVTVNNGVAGQLQFLGGTQTSTGVINGTGLIITAGTLAADSTTFASNVTAATVNAGAGTTIFSGTDGATTTNLTTGTLTLTGVATTALNFTGAGTANINGGLVGTVAFAGNDGVVNLADGKSLTVAGTVDTTGANTGTLNIAGTSGIAGAIGATQALKAVNVNGASGKTATFSGAISATTVNVGAGTATFSGLGTGALNFTADGTASAAKGWTGAVTTATANTGTLTFKTLAGGVTTTIGTALKPLKKLILTGVNLTTTGAVNAQTINTGNNVLSMGAAFTLASGQTLNVTPVGGASSAIKNITTTGANTISFATGSNILISPTGTPLAADTYDIALATGSTLTNAATIQSGVAGFTYAGTITGAGTILHITATKVAVTSNTDLAQVNITANNGVTAVGALNTLINAAPTLAAKNNLREAALPTVDGSGVFGMIDASGEVTSVIETHVASLTSGNSSGMAAGYGAKGDRAWMQGYANSANQDRRNGVAGYDSNFGGIALGYDSTNIIDGGVVGVAFNYGRTNADSNNVDNTSTDVNSYGFNVYGHMPIQDKMFIDAQTGYTYNDMQIDRRNTGAGLTANGNTSANQYSAKLALGRDYATSNGVKLTPTVFTDYNAVDTQSYTETGSGALLTVGSQTFRTLELGVNGKASWETKNHDGSMLRPEIHVGYAYDTIGDKIDVNSTFVGGSGAFKTNGIEPSRSKFNAGLGFVYSSPENWDVSARYNYVYKTDYESHNGTIRLTSHF